MKAEERRSCRAKVVTIRRRFSRLDKALMLAILVLILATVVLARSTLNLAHDTMALTDQLSEVTRENSLLMYALESRVAALENECGVIQEPNIVTEVTIDAPRTLEYTSIDVGLSNDVMEHTYNMAEKYNVPFSALLAIMDKESGFGVDIDNTNENGSTDIGIMQINSCNWDWLSDDHSLDVNNEYNNIEAGALILSKVWNKYTPEEAFAAYNMGEGGMNKYGVNDYGREVYQMYLNYESMLGG